MLEELDKAGTKPAVWDVIEFPGLCHLALDVTGFGR